MPSSSTKLAEIVSYNAVHVTPFAQIHRHPTRYNYKTLKKKAANLASKVDNLTFVWSHDPATGEEFGLFTEIIREVEYTPILQT